MLLFESGQPTPAMPLWPWKQNDRGFYGLQAHNSALFVAEGAQQWASNKGIRWVLHGLWHPRVAGIMKWWTGLLKNQFDALTLPPGPHTSEAAWPLNVAVPGKGLSLDHLPGKDQVKGVGSYRAF